MEVEAEKQFMGKGRAKLWTYLILGFLMILAIIIANWAIKNPTIAKHGVHGFLGLPSWAFPLVAFAAGALIFWLGLKVETDWPEAIGASLMAGGVGTGEIMIGWHKFQLGGITVLPYVIPIVLFLVLLAYGMTHSK